MTANLKCRSCKSQLFEPPLLSYKDSPISAQDFHNDPDQKDNNVNLDIYQCTKCNLVQHILPPVSYYKEVIRAVSVSKEMMIERNGYQFTFTRLTPFLIQAELKELAKISLHRHLGTMAYTVLNSDGSSQSNTVFQCDSVPKLL